MDVVLGLLAVILVVVVGLSIGGVPGYVIAKRRGLSNPLVAFVPFVGLWIVLFESFGRSGWLALLGLIPYIGWFLVPIWTGIAMPPHHGRSRWWTAALVVPVVNLVGYWVYAFTLPKWEDSSDLEWQGLAA